MYVTTCRRCLQNIVCENLELIESGDYYANQLVRLYIHEKWFFFQMKNFMMCCLCALVDYRLNKDILLLKSSSDLYFENFFFNIWLYISRNLLDFIPMKVIDISRDKLMKQTSIDKFSFFKQLNRYSRLCFVLMHSDKWFKKPSTVSEQ